MTPIETFLIAGPAVTGIAAFGLEWYLRQSKALRMRRSLRGYAEKTLTEHSYEMHDAFPVFLRAA